MSLDRHDLLRVRLDALSGKFPALEVVEHMAEVLEELLEEGSGAENHLTRDIAELRGVIETLEEQRKENLENAEKYEAERDELKESNEGLTEKRDELQSQLGEEKEKRLEMEKALDDLKKAHEELLANTRKVVPIRPVKKAGVASTRVDEQASGRVKKLEEDLEDERVQKQAASEGRRRAEENLMLVRERLQDAEKRIIEIEAENARLLANTDRGADWWRAKVREEIREENEKHFAAEREARRTMRRAAEEAEEDYLRLLVVLREIAAAPAEEAHRKIRILVARDVIEKTGTLACERYIPTRSERRRERGKR